MQLQIWHKKSFLIPPSWSKRTRHPTDPLIIVNWEEYNTDGDNWYRIPTRLEREDCTYSFSKMRFVELLSKYSNDIHCPVCGHRSCMIFLEVSSDWREPLSGPMGKAVFRHLGE